MNLENLTNEIKEKVHEGTKPSDLKKNSSPVLPKEKKNNATVSAVVSYRVENIEGAIKGFDKDLAIFKDNVSQKLEQIEKQTQTDLWEKVWRVVLLIGVIVAAMAACYCAYKQN